MKVEIGKSAPDFTLEDQDGKPFTLSSLKGKKIVLYFYPKDATPGCTAEACSLRDGYEDLQEEGYEVIGISTDTAATHKKFKTKENLPFTLVADPDKIAHEAYGTWVEKSMYGRKYMGTARITFLIDSDLKISGIIDKVDTKNHADQILDGPVEPKTTTAATPAKATKTKAVPPKKVIPTTKSLKPAKAKFVINTRRTSGKAGRGK